MSLTEGFCNFCCITLSASSASACARATYILFFGCTFDLLATSLVPDSHSAVDDIAFCYTAVICFSPTVCLHCSRIAGLHSATRTKNTLCFPFCWKPIAVPSSVWPPLRHQLKSHYFRFRLVIVFVFLHCESCTIFAGL